MRCLNCEKYKKRINKLDQIIEIEEFQKDRLKEEIKELRAKVRELLAEER